MKISGMLRGSTWWRRCSRASSGSMVSLPMRFGRQCRMNTWTAHSKNGNNASITTGTSASVICQSPTTMRACQRGGQSGANHPGGGVFPELATRIAQREALARGALGRDGHGCSSKLVIAASIAAVAGSRRSIAAFSRRRGRPPRSRRRGPGRPPGGRPRRPSRRREPAAQARTWPEACCTSAGTRWNRRRRRRGPRRSARGAAARPGRVSASRLRTASSRSAANSGRRRTAASSATFGPLCNRASRMLRTTERSSSPARSNNRGRRSSPACRRKSRTVVASPWRTSTRPAAETRLSASRTAGRDTPSTSARRRSLGSVCPGCISPLSTSARICSKTSSGTERRFTGCRAMAPEWPIRGQRSSGQTTAALPQR